MRATFLSPWVGVASLAIASSLQAAAIVDWGGNYVSTTVPFVATSGNNIGGFSGGNPQLISPPANYTGGNFYGHVAWTSTGADGAYAQMVNASSLDRIEIKRYSADIKSLILWRQADFLNGLNTGNVGFDATSTVAMNLNTLVNFDAGRVVIRLQGGAQDGYYISSETPFNGTGLKSANLTSLTWLAYDPATSLIPTVVPATNLVTGGVIEHVTEIGFYTRSTATSANAFRLDAFDVTASIVPEPAMLTFALAGALGLRRRR